MAMLRFTALLALFCCNFVFGSEWWRLWPSNKGTTHFNEGKYEEALSEYSKNLERWPENPALLYNKAATLYKLQRYHEAVALFQKAGNLCTANKSRPCDQLFFESWVGYANSNYFLAQSRDLHFLQLSADINAWLISVLDQDKSLDTGQRRLKLKENLKHTQDLIAKLREIEEAKKRQAALARSAAPKAAPNFGSLFGASMEHLQKLAVPKLSVEEKAEMANLEEEIQRLEAEIARKREEEQLEKESQQKEVDPKLKKAFEDYFADLEERSKNFTAAARDGNLRSAARDETFVPHSQKDDESLKSTARDEEEIKKNLESKARIYHVKHPSQAYYLTGAFSQWDDKKGWNVRKAWQDLESLEGEHGAREEILVQARLREAEAAPSLEPVEIPLAVRPGQRVDPDSFLFEKREGLRYRVVKGEGGELALLVSGSADEHLRFSYKSVADERKYTAAQRGHYDLHFEATKFDGKIRSALAKYFYNGMTSRDRAEAVRSYIWEHANYTLDNDLDAHLRKEGHEGRNFLEKAQALLLQDDPEVRPDVPAALLGKHGDCDTLATVAVHMLRQQGIPARLAIGAVKDFEGAGPISSSATGHGWVLYFDAEEGKWLPLDVTPKADGKTLHQIAQMKARKAALEDKKKLSENAFQSNAELLVRLMNQREAQLMASDALLKQQNEAHGDGKEAKAAATSYTKLLAELEGGIENGLEAIKSPGWESLPPELRLFSLRQLQRNIAIWGRDPSVDRSRAALWLEQIEKAMPGLEKAPQLARSAAEGEKSTLIRAGQHFFHDSGSSPVERATADDMGTYPFLVDSYTSRDGKSHAYVKMSKTMPETRKRNFEIVLPGRKISGQSSEEVFLAVNEDMSDIYHAYATSHSEWKVFKNGEEVASGDCEFPHFIHRKKIAFTCNEQLYINGVPYRSSLNPEGKVGMLDGYAILANGDVIVAYDNHKTLRNDKELLGESARVLQVGEDRAIMTIYGKERTKSFVLSSQGVTEVSSAQYALAMEAHTIHQDGKAITRFKGKRMRGNDVQDLELLDSEGQPVTAVEPLVKRNYGYERRFFDGEYSVAGGMGGQLMSDSFGSDRLYLKLGDGQIENPLVSRYGGPIYRIAANGTLQEAPAFTNIEGKSPRYSKEHDAIVDASSLQWFAGVDGRQVDIYKGEQAKLRLPEKGGVSSEVEVRLQTDASAQNLFVMQDIRHNYSSSERHLYFNGALVASKYDIESLEPTEYTVHNHQSFAQYGETAPPTVQSTAPYLAFKHPTTSLVLRPTNELPKIQENLRGQFPEKREDFLRRSQQLPSRQKIEEGRLLYFVRNYGEHLNSGDNSDLAQAKERVGSALMLSFQEILELDITPAEMTKLLLSLFNNQQLEKLNEKQIRELADKMHQKKISDAFLSQVGHASYAREYSIKERMLFDRLNRALGLY
jgi:hypothetical protein